LTNSKNLLTRQKKTHESILYDQFENFCEDIGVEKDQVPQYLHGLISLGLLVYVPSTTSEFAKIYLEPQVVNTLISKKLNLESISMTQAERKTKLKKLKKELKALLSQFQVIEFRAHRFGLNTVIFTLAFLIGQFILFGRLTWYDSSWDVMEPITYFTQVVEVILFGYLYYLYQRSEFSGEGIRQAIYSWKVSRIASRSGISLTKIAELKQEINTVENDIAYHEHQ